MALLCSGLHDHVRILLGGGSGVLTAGTTIDDFPGPGNVMAIAAADFNHDGKPDLVLPQYSYDPGHPATVGIVSIHSFLNNGNATFNRTTSTIAVSTDAFSVRAMVAEDFNGDALPDLAIAEADESVKVLTLLNSGNSAFSLHSERLLTDVMPDEARHGYLAAEDFNGDLKKDLAYSLTSGPDETPIVGVMLGDGSGNMSIASRAPYSSPARSPPATSAATAESISRSGSRSRTRFYGY